MKVLIIGSTGFIGASAAKILSKEFEVVTASRHQGRSDYSIDLMDVASIESVLQSAKPDAVINCAGIVGAVDTVENNELFTEKLLTAIKITKLPIRRIIISGSAGEYGMVDALPVPETAPLRGTSDYAMSKIKEEATVYDFFQNDHLPVVVARIFNPIGVGMNERFLVPNLLKQITEYKLGKIDHVTISRLDSKRDYILVDDISYAFAAILKGKPHHFAYNIGSGRATSNGDLLTMIIKNEAVGSPKIIESSDTAEPLVASQADIQRMKNDFDWRPQFSLEEEMKEIIYEYRH